MTLLSKMNFSFAGCGFIGIYHVGVAACLKEYAPEHVLVEKIAGASAGALAACALFCGVSLSDMATTGLRAAVLARQSVLGPFHPSYNINKIIADGLDATLPENAHELCDNRLHISVTKVRDGTNHIINRFASREDLIQALVCSCYIPLFSGFVPPRYRGEPYVDGGFSNNLPKLDDYTVTVSPFAGECDICPQDNFYDLLQINLANTSINVSPFNVYRLSKTIFPPHPDILSKICKQGFDDALKFLQRNSLITCKRCLAVHTSIQVEEQTTAAEPVPIEDTTVVQIEDDCRECRARKQVALSDKLPEGVCTVLQEAVDQVNKGGAINWLFRRGPVKFLLLPITLPLDIVIIFFCKIWEKIPELQKQLHHLLTTSTLLVHEIYKALNLQKHFYSAKLSCDLAITEYDYHSPLGTPEATALGHDTLDSACSPPMSLIQSRQDAAAATPRRTVLSAVTKPTKRMSYAGQPSTVPIEISNRCRRHSLEHFPDPERCINSFKYKVTFNLGDNGAGGSTVPDNGRELVSALHSAESGKRVDPNLVTNRALNLEKDYMGQFNPENALAFSQYCNIASEKPLMSYYYLDEKNKMKVTEIFDVDPHKK